MTERMRLYAFHCGTERSDRAVFDPFDPRVGEKILSPYFLYLVQHPQGWVLIDTGLHPALRTDPHGYLGAAADSFSVERLTEDDDVVSKLAMLGLSPDDVHHVVQTHLHFDHAGGLRWFPHATIYVQASELPFAYWPPVYQRGVYVKADFDHPLKWKELAGEYDLFDDGRIVLFPTPGPHAGAPVGAAAARRWQRDPDRRRALPGREDARAAAPLGRLERRRDGRELAPARGPRSAQRRAS